MSDISTEPRDPSVNPDGETVPPGTTSPAARLADSNHPLAGRFKALLAATDGGDASRACGILDELEEEASFHGYDRLADAVLGLRRAFADLGDPQRRQRIEELVLTLPQDLGMVAPVVRDEALPFDRLLQSVPGVGPKKVQLIISSGITDRAALRTAGVERLTALPGITEVQAEMLMAECAEAAPPFSPFVQETELQGLASRILQDDFDTELIDIFIDSTIERVGRLREALKDRQLDQARSSLGRLITAAEDMGYIELLEALQRVAQGIEAETQQPGSLAQGVLTLQRIGSELADLRRRCSPPAGMADGAPAPGAEKPKGAALPPITAETVDQLYATRHSLAEIHTALQELAPQLQEVVARIITGGGVSDGDAAEMNSIVVRLEERLADLERTGSQLSDSVRQLGLVPVQELFGRLALLATDLAEARHCQVAVSLAGGETGLGQAVVEQLVAPLQQLVRNAVLHGIETADVRTAGGKSAQPEIAVAARREEDAVFIDVQDDGRGFDLECVRNWLAESGLRPPEEVAALDEGELLQVIFLPGFAMTKELGENEGLGVGLDVVKQQIQALGGQITVSSECGRYTRFTVRLQ